MLLEGGFITDQQLTQARDLIAADGSGLLDTLVSHGMLAQETLVTVLSFQLRIPVVDLRLNRRKGWSSRSRHRLKRSRGWSLDQCQRRR